MHVTRRIAAPALALLVTLGASGCAGMSFGAACGGIGQVDPMSDGASRLNRNFQRHQAVATHQAYQAKSTSLISSKFSRDFRRPGQPNVQISSSPMCLR